MGQVRTAPAIRPATCDDLDVIDAIEAASFALDRFPRRNLRRMLAGGRTRFWIALSGDVPVGYAAFSFRAGAGTARLYSLAVLPEFKGQGLGQGLIEAGIAYASNTGHYAMRLEVRETNQAARKLYERLGFRLLSRHTSYYEDGETALRYERLIAGPEDRVQERDPL